MLCAVREDGQGLIEKGYARKLTENEAQTILSEYVKCAEDLFSKIPEKKSVSANKGHKAVYQERLL